MHIDNNKSTKKTCNVTWQLVQKKRHEEEKELKIPSWRWHKKYNADETAAHIDSSVTMKKKTTKNLYAIYRWIIT